MLISRTAYDLLYLLIKEEAVSSGSAMTIDEIMMTGRLEKCPVKATVYREVERLRQYSLVSYGGKDGKAYTYYITEKGKEFYTKNV